MTMAKSRTRKKSAKPKDNMPQDVSHVVDQVTDYIKLWTNRELGKLQLNHDTSICIPIKNGYRIGLYRVDIHPNHTCDVVAPQGNIVHRFENKVSAVLYTIYTIKQKYRTADNIIALDKEINKNYIDSLALRRGIERARKQRDYVSVDIKTARLDEAEKKLALARQDLVSVHRVAKFAKVWQ
jgi:hypothetical protein